MSKFFSFCQTNNKKHNLKHAPQQLSTKKINTPQTGLCFYASCFLIGIMCMTTVFYLYETTSSVTLGIEISNQKEKISQLKLSNEELAQQINTLEDLKYIKQAAHESGLVVLSNVDYIENVSTNMAVNK